MAKEGWEPIISAFFGHRGKVFKADGIVHLPGSHHDWGEDIMFAHYEHYKPDAFVLLIDVWVYANDKLREIPNLTSWCPIDHVTIPPQVQEKLEHCRYVWSMSRHGQRLLDAAGIRNTYVPHGVDTAVYTPVDRASARETLSLPADAFVAVCVAANKGYPDRKQLRSLLKAWSVFVKAHPGAVLYLHTDAYPTMGGVHVHKIAEFYGIPDTNLVLPDVYRHVRGDYSPAIMNLIYNAADVFILPSAGEGFGIPVVEAQACFPAGTEIQASGVVRGMSRMYTGEMVTITTARGSFEATANHPIWTKTGWKHAGDIAIGDEMLYTLSYHNEGEQHAGQGLSEVYAGPIDCLVRRLQANASEGGRESGWHDVPSRNVAGAPIRLGQSVRGYFASKGSSVKRGSVSLYRWLDRWRGLNSGAQDARWQGKAVSPYIEYGHVSNGLAGFNVERSVHIYSSFTKGKAPSLAAVSLSHRGVNLSTALQGAVTLPHCQEGAYGTHDRVVRNTPRSDENGPLHREAAIHHAAYPTAQYEDVTAVSRRSVIDLPVYNLTTESGTYTAGGYLVHNCGTPVIVTDATAQAELCGAGWKIPIDPLDDQLITLQYAEQAVVKPSKIVAALEQAYAAKGDEALRAKARAFALQYDVDTVWNEYMKPAILAQVADRQSIEGARVQRTEARLKLRAGEPFSPYPTPCACNTPGAPFCNSDCEYAAYAEEGQSELEVQE